MNFRPLKVAEMLATLDIGGTKVAAALTQAGRVLDRRQLPMVSQREDLQPLLASLLHGWEGIQKIGVATTGYVQQGRVYSVNHDIIGFWNGLPLQDILRGVRDVPVVMLNDAQAAAWGEYLARQQEGNGPADLMFITLSTGIGGGLVLNHRLRTGQAGLAGHIGHIPSHIRSMDGQLRCGCGQTGCLELIASGTGLARQASTLMGETCDSRSLFMLAQQHPAAERLIQHAADAVAAMLASQHLALDLQEIVIGGSVGMAPGMLERIQRAFSRIEVPAAPVISAARCGADAGLAGIMHWAGARS
ncbi:ROK family protein [Undibacterium luofuense]|uniref:ROK family protein n=1 Tax=Undibacterium luofuense TaxID=2828733 RepID=UPI0030EE4E68